MARRRGSLRIVAGELRGRSLRVPRGVRPTTDRVRAAIFDALQEVPPAQVLDCFAGSGGMGFEALSRGAEFATFIERSPRAAAGIRSSALDFGLSDACTVIVGDALAADLALHGPFGLVLADPPYAFDAWENFFRLITRPGVLHPAARLVAEYSGRLPPPPPPPGWSVWKTRRHGDAAFTIYRSDLGVRRLAAALPGEGLLPPPDIPSAHSVIPSAGEESAGCIPPPPLRCAR